MLLNASHRGFLLRGKSQVLSRRLSNLIGLSFVAFFTLMTACAAEDEESEVIYNACINAASPVQCFETRSTSVCSSRQVSCTRDIANNVGQRVRSCIRDRVGRTVENLRDQSGWHLTSYHVEFLTQDRIFAVGVSLGHLPFEFHSFKIHHSGDHFLIDDHLQNSREREIDKLNALADANDIKILDYNSDRYLRVSLAGFLPRLRSLIEAHRLCGIHVPKTGADL